MNTLNHIGLEKEKSVELALKLGNLLANYSVFYQNVRGFHWNIKGDKFFELHEKFEELYNDLFMKIDEIAERILTLGEEPGHKFSAYLKISEIQECDDTTESSSIIRNILESFKILIVKQREILDLSGELDDEGTNALMSDYIREQEKLVWMYSAYMQK
jgi:starvation-inducible DNA-binding protein